MIDVRPQVFLIGQPMINTDEMLEYLRAVGGQKWFERIGAKVALNEIPAAEGMIEFMGRLCYRSWEPGLNKNVTKIREDRKDYLLNILRSGHGSVLTHSWFGFAIHNGSRVFTAEMNRHAVGTAISEQSLRYVRLDKDLPFRLPHDVLLPETIERGRALVEHIESEIGEMYATEGIDAEGASFHEKKTKTSAIRRFAPLGIATEEGWSANVRTLRHVIEMRTALGAEEEIRDIAHQIGMKMATACPLLFGDYKVEAADAENFLPPVWTTEHRKV